MRATWNLAFVGLAMIMGSMVASAAPPPKPIVGNSWEGTFQSGLTDFGGSLRIGMDEQLLPYIEQDNIFAAVVEREVDRDGSMMLTAYDPTAKVFIMLAAEPVDWNRDGEATKMRGDYQVFRLDPAGRKRVLDQGTLGIIAILIGL